MVYLCDNIKYLMREKDREIEWGEREREREREREIENEVIYL